MKLKFLLLITAILVSCSKESSVLKLIPNQENKVNSSQFHSAFDICQKNDGIDKFEIRTNSKESVYFFCNKQGFLEVDSLGKIKTVKQKDLAVKEVSNTFVLKCSLFCKNKISSLSPSQCDCEDGKQTTP